MTGALLWLLLLAAPEPAPLFHDPFDDNTTGWVLDEQWRFEAGELCASGLADKILLLDAAQPHVADFRAQIDCRLLSEPPEDQIHGYGFAYRYDRDTGSGYFLSLGADGLYGLGVVENHHFQLIITGQSEVLAERAGPLELQVRGGVHTLRGGGELVDVWRDERFSAGGIGLLCIGPIEVAFADLRIDDLGGQPRTTLPTALQLGPTPPAGGGAPPPAAQGVLRASDVVLARRWRAQWNKVAASLGEPTLPAELDGCDLAVLGLLRFRLTSGVAAPAKALADLLGERPLIERGAVGPAPEAALEYWLASVGEPLGGDETSDLLAGLDWYFALRRRAAEEWGTRSHHPLFIGNELMGRLSLDAQRYEREVPEAERPRRERELAQVIQQVRALLTSLGGGATP